MIPGVRRVVFLSDAIKERNGVGTYYTDLTDHLRERLEQAVLICPDFQSNGRSRHFCSFAMPGDPTQRLYLPRFGELAQQVIRILPDIIVAPTPGPYGFYGLRLARKMGVGCCIGYHTDFERIAHLYWNRLAARISMKAVKAVNRLLFKRGAIIVANSDDMLDAARRAGAVDARLVGTPVGKCFLDAPRTPIAPELDTVLFAGRLAPEKNLDQVLAAAEQLPDLRFIIAGDGPLRPQVERSAQRCRNVDYRGWTSRAALLKLMDEAQMLVLPSTIESFGTIALEMMCRERLALVSPQCGINEWPDLAAGIYRINAGESLAAALQRVRGLQSAERREKAGVALNAARQLTEETLQQWLAIFEEIHRRQEQL